MCSECNCLQRQPWLRRFQQPEHEIRGCRSANRAPSLIRRAAGTYALYLLVRTLAQWSEMQQISQGT